MPQTLLRMLLAAALFLAWLPWHGYAPDQLRYDAGQYWELAQSFVEHGRFGLLHYHADLRGYAGPLLLLPALALRQLTGWAPLTCAGVWGAGWAGLLLGGVLPAGWRLATGQGWGWGRWLAVVGLAWLFWRGYFLFPLMDAAALTLFGAGLVGLGQRRAGAWLAAGLALGLALNVRPTYLASLPVVAALAWGLSRRLGQAETAEAPEAEAPPAPRPAAPAARRLLAGALLALGLALPQVPQLLINQRHHHRSTAAVLWDQADPRPVYLRALGWGTRVERYETGFFAGGARTLLVPDRAGVAQMQPYGPYGFRRYADYARFVLRHPLGVAGRYARHLAHSFDPWYATPYPTAARWPGQWPFRLLNYALLGLGLAALGRRPRRGAALGRGLLLALALPVLLTVPFHVETRYALPLHLVLLAAAVAGPWPRGRRWALAGAVWLAAWAWEAQRQERLAVFDPVGLET